LSAIQLGLTPVYDPVADLALARILRRSGGALCLLRQLVEQSLCFLEVRQIEALREPGVNGREKISRLTAPATTMPEAAECRRRAEFKQSGTLLSCH
jgi:hypothetical protein